MNTPPNITQSLHGAPEAQKQQSPADRPGLAEGQTKESTNAAPAYRTRPTPGTQAADVLEWLESGRTLTQHEATHEIGTTRLAAVVHDLRRAGWPIASETITAPTRRGNTHVARYSLGGGA